MEYQVPQFVEVEDKIFGPFTWRQFVYLAGGVGVCVLLILYLPLTAAILVGLPVAGLTAALAFYKVNNKSFSEMIAAGFAFYTTSRLYLWRKDRKADAPHEPAPRPVAAPERQKLGISGRRLKDLAWSLDIKDANDAPDA